MFRKVLVANRGEIAVRIIRALKEMGIASVAIYSDADLEAPHVEAADEAYRVGDPPPAASYLNIPAILEAARASGAEAIHPGYGFLSENPEFARACEETGLVFIGPPPLAMELSGDKAAARRTAVAAGVPVVPGTLEAVASREEALSLAREVGFPLAVKAAFGGGGRGMKLVEDEASLEAALESAEREARSYFGRPEVYLERYLPRARHVEAQVLGDRYGNLCFLGERECSLQRRHQKLLEESPSPVVDSELREKLGRAALAFARAVGYQGAGTVEFLLAPDGSFYFLEMNTRLQVEHPITEMVTGVDLVQAQIRVAAGEPLWLPGELELRGHAMECRINAEDPARRFLPRPGTITRYREPQGPWVRVDSGVREGWTVPPHYDSLLSKVITWGATREEARRRMARALEEYVIEGVATTIPFHRLVLSHPAFVSGEIHTGFVEGELDLSGLPRQEASAPSATPRPRVFLAEVGGKRFEVRLYGGEPSRGGEPSPAPRRNPGVAVAARKEAVRAEGPEEVRAPMQGVIVKVLVSPGQEVRAGQVVCTLEAMKMENHILTHRSGRVKTLACEPGQKVESGALLAVVE